jgi:hypothetical protein
VTAGGGAGQLPGGGAEGRAAADARAEVRSDLVSALAGTQASRDCATAFQTRRVVGSSLGLMREQQAGRRRIRAVALAAILLVVMFLGPMVWYSVNRLLEAEHWRDVTCQLALWVCILCPALVACALLAGWVRKRS